VFPLVTNLSERLARRGSGFVGPKWT
jgi:hypothetical protein